jgi:long-chain fatty acid transport protein
MKRRGLAAGVAALASLLVPHRVQGAAFFIQEQSIAGMGRAYGGESAVADTAATIFFNPAGLTYLDRPQVLLQGFLLVPVASFDNTGTVIRTPATNGVFRPVQGGDGGNPYGPAVTGSIFGSMPVLQDRLWVGLGVTSPYGLLVSYPASWFGRYDSVKSRLLTFNFAPTAAVRATDWLSLGVSLNIEYARALLRNAFPNIATPGGPKPQGDGRGTVFGTNTAVGFTLGALLQPFDRARFGVAWRWGITHDLEGTIDVTGLKGILRVANEHTTGSAELDLPQTVMIGGLYELSDRVRLLGQVNWYGWSSFQEIRVVPDNGSPPLVDPQNFHDTFGLAGGVEWQITDTVRLRTGLQYDETPTRDRFRNSRIPDGNRYLLGAGLSWNVTEDFEATVGYMHAFVSDATFQRNRTIYPGTPVASSYHFNADAQAKVNILGAGLTFRF